MVVVCGGGAGTPLRCLASRCGFCTCKSKHETQRSRERRAGASGSVKHTVTKKYGKQQDGTDTHTNFLGLLSALLWSNSFPTIHPQNTHPSLPRFPTLNPTTVPISTRICGSPRLRKGRAASCRPRSRGCSRSRTSIPRARGCRRARRRPRGARARRGTRRIQSA